LAGESGIGIAIHQHAKGESRYWHPDSVLAALEGRPNLGVCADLGHWVRSGIDPVEALAKLSGKVLSVHAKDLDESGKIQANDVRIGTGVIDYQAVIDELKRQQFTGLVFIECEHNWLDNLADVSAGVQYLDSLAAAR
ncbi:MAG: sugar phosphate isomerase/epimerase, partial [Solitalea sp.]